MKKIEEIWILTMILVGVAFFVIGFFGENAVSQNEYGVEVQCDESEKLVNFSLSTTYKIKLINTGENNTWEKIEMNIKENNNCTYWKISLNETILILNKNESNPYQQGSDLI